MKKDLSHLMMHICVEPVTGGLFGRQTHTRGAHTDGPDGHIIELLKHNPPQASGDVIDMDVDGPLPAPKEEAAFVHNTVDFAQREKEEMQDLTKASEIISLFPTSLINTPVGSPGSSPLEERTSTPQQRHRSHSLASSHHPYRSTRPSHLQFLPQVQPSITSQQNIPFPLLLPLISTSRQLHPILTLLLVRSSLGTPTTCLLPQESGGPVVPMMIFSSLMVPTTRKEVWDSISALNVMSLQLSLAPPTFEQQTNISVRWTSCGQRNTSVKCKNVLITVRKLTKEIYYLGRLQMPVLSFT